MVHVMCNQDVLPNVRYSNDLTLASAKLIRIRDTRAPKLYLIVS